MLEKLGEKMEEFEERLLKGPNQETLKQIYILKRENLLLRKSVWPLREVVTQLELSESPLIMKKTAPYGTKDRLGDMIKEAVITNR